MSDNIPLDLPKELRAWADYLGGDVHLMAAADEIERLQSALARCANIAGMCRMEMQGRLSDDEHHRAFRALGAIQLNAVRGTDG